MDKIEITSAAWGAIMASANEGGWSERAITLLDDSFKQVQTIVPGQVFWLVIDDCYDSNIIRIGADGVMHECATEED